jgi:hypothetical protein
MRIYLYKNFVEVTTGGCGIDKNVIMYDEIVRDSLCTNFI